MFPCLAKNRYFYLDWNIFARLRDLNTPLDGKLLNAILKFKKEGFYFPYSEAHIRDLFNKSDFKINEFTQKNFNIIRMISDNVCICHEENTGNLFLNKCDLRDAFNILRNNNVEQAYIPKNLFGKDFYNALRDCFIHDKGNIIEGLLYNGYIEYANIVKCLSTDNEEYLEKNFLNTIISLHNITRQGQITNDYIIQNGFRFLDFTRLFNEKITNKNAPLNVFNDSNHLYAALDSRFFLTEDVALIKKISFFKKCYFIPIQTIKIEEFCRMIDCGLPPIAL